MPEHQVYTLVLILFFAIAAGLVGCFALMKRMLLASDVMSHLALPGLGVAFLLKFDPLVGGSVTLLLGTLLVWQLQKKTGLATDAAIGVVFAGALALGALLTPREDLVDALFGGLRELTPYGFLLGLLGVLLAILFIFLMKERLTLVLFSPDLAATTGINARLMDLSFLLMFSLTILIGLRFMGALLSSVLIIVPAATARQLTNRMSHFLVVSSVASVFSALAGLLVSTFVLRRSTVSPTIAIVSASVFGLSLLARRK